MKKSLIWCVAIIVVIAVVVGCIVFINKNNTNTTNNGGSNATGQVASVKLESVDDLKNVIEEVYKKSENDMFGLETKELDLTDEMALTSYTGLKSAENLNKVVISESMITSRAYSLALVKVKAGADVEAIKKDMVDNVDMRRWICVSADVVYATNKDDVIFMIMASEDLAKPQLDGFKAVVGSTGKDLQREVEPLDF